MYYLIHYILLKLMNKVKGQYFWCTCLQSKKYFFHPLNQFLVFVVWWRLSSTCDQGMVTGVEWAGVGCWVVGVRWPGSEQCWPETRQRQWRSGAWPEKCETLLTGDHFSLTSHPLLIININKQYWRCDLIQCCSRNCYISLQNNDEIIYLDQFWEHNLCKRNLESSFFISDIRGLLFEIFISILAILTCSCLQMWS